jgi:hypothetical protein
MLAESHPHFSVTKFLFAVEGMCWRKPFVPKSIIEKGPTHRYAEPCIRKGIRDRMCFCNPPQQKRFQIFLFYHYFVLLFILEAILLFVILRHIDVSFLLECIYILLKWLFYYPSDFPSCLYRIFINSSDWIILISFYIE